MSTKLHLYLKQPIFNDIGQHKQYHYDILSESIKPRPVPYGTDFVNHQWRQLQGGQWVTFFRSNKDLFVVIYHMGSIAFGHNYFKPDVDISDIQTYDQLRYNYSFNVDKGHHTNALLVFNQVFYVILDAIRKFDPEVVKFGSGSVKLEDMYKQLVRNKSFTQVLDDAGYFFTGHMAREFIFLKKEYL